MKLTFNDVSKQYKDKKVVDHFSAELTEGVHGLLAPNGAGKTTLIRMIANVLQPTSGEILLNDVEINTLGDGYREQLGYLPQHFGYYKHFTGLKFLLYMASLKGLQPKLAKERAEELIELVNLKQYANNKVGTYSGGMKQRLGIAQALLNDPKLLIVDEPTAGLDPKERISFRNIISELSSDRIVILSTHIVSDIEFIAKEIILMQEGRLLHQGEPAKLLEKMQGLVWSAVVGEEHIRELKHYYKVGNILRTSQGFEVRVIAKQQPVPQAKLETPRLEDLYLHYFHGEERAQWDY